MAFFSHLSPDEVVAEFTHEAWLGLCPVWLNVRTCVLSERNWVPEWWLWFNIGALVAAGRLVEAMGGTSVNGWPIRVTRPLPGKGSGQR